MSWDLILTPYDEREYRALLSLARSPGAARVLRDRLQLRVRLLDRDPDGVALLNEASDLRPWLQVAFAETVTRGSGVLLGRGATLDDYAGAVLRRYGEPGRPVRERLASLGQSDPLLTRAPLGTAGRVFVAGSERVGELAGLIRAMDPAIPPLAPEAAEALLRAGPPDLVLLGEPFYDWALPAVLGFLLWVAEEEELGLAVSFDGLPRLKAAERFRGSKRELELEVPRRLEVLERGEAELRERGLRRSGCLLPLVVMALMFLLALLALYAVWRIRGPNNPFSHRGGGAAPAPGMSAGAGPAGKARRAGEAPPARPGT